MLRVNAICSAIVTRFANQPDSRDRHAYPASDRIRFCAIVFPMASTDPARELLRHTLAALAYRAARALEGAPDHFAGFAGAGRMPVQILAHMGDLFDWAFTISLGD